MRCSFLNQSEVASRQRDSIGRRDGNVEELQPELRGHAGRCRHCRLNRPVGAPAPF